MTSSQEPRAKSQQPRPFLLRVRVCSSFIATCLLNLAALRSLRWLAWLVPASSQKALCNPGMNCHGCPWAVGACPIGVMACGSAVHTLPVYAISFVLVLSAVLGRLTCAFLCPFGLLQDLLYKIPFFRIKLPRWTRYGKYLALALLVFILPYWLGFEQSGYLKVNKPVLNKAVAVDGDESDAAGKLDVTIAVENLGPKPVVRPQVDLVYLSAGKEELFRTRKEYSDVTVAPGDTVTLPKIRIPDRLSEGVLSASSPQSEVEQSSPYNLYYCRLCPVGTLEATLPAFASGTSGGMYAWASGRSMRIGILAAFLLLMVMVSRPFCRTFCPAGAIYALCSRVALSRMNLDKNACIHCGACNRVCPVDLDVPSEVGGPECIACGDCRKVCPKGGIKRTFGL
ncbi:MAG: 4Fe-4S binding protein [Planctomycetota bacterium]|nr:4Fe-4S binding protein [Planctomycetota bacterium]